VADVERDDYVWLTGDEAARWLALVAADAEPVERLAVRLRRDLTATRTHLVLEQVELRRRARVKFSQADRMFFTRQTLEQATDERLAEWKALRFLPDACVADLCAGIGGDALALAGRGRVLAVERDPCVAWLLDANGRSLGKTGLQVVVADVDRVLDDGAHEFRAGGPRAWHLDPDRRATGTRTTNLAHCQPGPESIERWRTWSSSGAVKLAPATQVPDDLASESQREWVETRGECRQQLLWFGQLALAPGRRSATIVDRGDAPRVVVESAEVVEPFVVDRPRKYIGEPRPAIYAAGLTATLARELEAASLGVEHGYLTCDEPRDDAAWQQFEVLEVLPFDRRRLKAVLRARRWRTVVWKSRGVAADLARLARDMACAGDESGVVLLTEFAGRTWAVLGRSVGA